MKDIFLIICISIFEMGKTIKKMKKKKRKNLTEHIKINYEAGSIGRFSEKTQRCIQNDYDSDS